MGAHRELRRDVSEAVALREAQRREQAQQIEQMAALKHLLQRQQTMMQMSKDTATAEQLEQSRRIERELEQQIDAGQKYIDELERQDTAQVAHADQRFELSSTPWHTRVALTMCNLLAASFLVLQHVFMATPHLVPFIFALLALHIEVLGYCLSLIRFAHTVKHQTSIVVLAWLRRVGVLALLVYISYVTFRHDDMTHDDHELVEKLHNGLAVLVLCTELMETQMHVNAKVREE